MEPASTPPLPVAAVHSRSTTIVALQTLERVSRALLVRLLAPHASFFAAHGVTLDALAATAQTDRALVRRIHDLLHSTAHASLPTALVEMLSALHHLATPRGRDAILALDRGDAATPPRFPRGALSNEDLAATALLEAPELADDALDECGGAADDALLRGATELDPADRRPFACDASFLHRLADNFGARMDKRDRTRLCDVHARHTADAVYLEIAYGKVPTARDFVRAPTSGDQAFAIAQSTDVVTERARVRFCKKTWRVALKAPHAAIKEDLRCALGEAAYGNAQHWRSDATCSLDAFASLESALACDDVPGLSAVDLHGFAVLTTENETIEFSRPRQSLLTTSAKHLHEAALALGKVVQVRLVLKLASGARVSVKVTAKRGDNRIDYPRDDAAVDRVVRDYLVARGVVRDAVAAEALAATA